MTPSSSYRLACCIPAGSCSCSELYGGSRGRICARTVRRQSEEQETKSDAWWGDRTEEGLSHSIFGGWRSARGESRLRGGGGGENTRLFSLLNDVIFCQGCTVVCKLGSRHSGERRLPALVVTGQLPKNLVFFQKKVDLNFFAGNTLFLLQNLKLLWKWGCLQKNRAQKVENWPSYNLSKSLTQNFLIFFEIFCDCREKFSSQLRKLITRSILNLLSSSFLQTSSFWCQFMILQ